MESVVLTFAVIGLAWLGLVLCGSSPLTLLGSALNTLRSARNPASTCSVETNIGATQRAELDARNAPTEGADDADSQSWASYNRTLTPAGCSPLRATKPGGAIDGEAITHEAGGCRRIAITADVTSLVWPTEQSTAKIVILGMR
jgi:hypothetical protein